MVVLSHRSIVTVRSRQRADGFIGRQRALFSSFAEIAAPLALVLPITGMGTVSSELDVPAPVPEVQENAQQLSEPPVQSSIVGSGDAGISSFEAFKQSLAFGQITLRQRVYIRISPRRGNARRNMLAQARPVTQPARYKEGKANDCVSVDRIADVQTGSGNRLLLFMHDADIMSVNLEKACRAKDFYAGFYVEKSKDGKLCVKRDRLQSRNGARCSIQRMAQLVAIKD